MGLLFINSLKGFLKKKIQLIAIVLLIAISITLYTASIVSVDNLETEYYNYLDDYNVEHFSFSPKIDYKNLDEKLLNLIEEQDLTEQESEIVEIYKLCLDNCDEYVYINLDLIVNKYDLKIKANEETIKELSEKHNFDYKISESKLTKTENTYHLYIPYTPDNKLNKIHIIDGITPKNTGECAILEGYANANDIEVNDKLEVNNTECEVVGIVLLSEFVYPMVTFNVPIFNEKTNNIILLPETDFEEIKGYKESVVSIRFKEDVSFKNRMNNDFSDEGDNVYSNLLKEESITMEMSSFFRILRTDMIQNDIEPNKIFTESFLYLLLGITGFILIVIIRKRIEDEKKQIGILKALGYKNSSISASYLIYPLIGVTLGVIIGYFIGLILSMPMTDLYLKYYNVPVTYPSFSLDYFAKVMMIPLVILSIISYLTAYLMVKKKPLDLMKEGSNLKVNIFSKISNKILSKFKFKTRFKYALAFRSLGKLMIVSFVSFSTGLLIVLILIGSSLFSGIVDQTLGQMEFKYLVQYNGVVRDNDSTSDMIFAQDLKISEKNGEVLEEEIDANFMGIDEELKFLKLDITKESKEDLSNGEGIIITKRLAEVEEIKTGDKLSFKVSNENVEFEVIEILEEYLNNTVYIDRNTFTKEFGFEEEVYNLKYSSNDKYKNNEGVSEEELSLISTIINFDDLENSIRSQVEVFETFIYIIILFSGIMAFIIILVIANIVVLENKKTISLMKVLGYKDKEISKIVLNIYTPFIILAYLISVPAMIEILKTIIEKITGDIGLYIPIEINYYQIGLGLLVLLVAYYFGVYFSKKVLHKIPLAVALKRE